AAPCITTATVSDAEPTEGQARTIAAEAAPASAAATTYFQTASTIEPIPRRAGRPAYQSAGITRSQDDTTHAVAIPTGPHGNARTNSSPITVSSMIPQRSRRSARPIER